MICIYILLVVAVRIKYNRQSPRSNFPELSWVQIQFHIQGAKGTAQVTADMYQDQAKEWQYRMLVMDLLSTSPTQRVVLEEQNTYLAS